MAMMAELAMPGRCPRTSSVLHKRCMIDKRQIRRPQPPLAASRIIENSRPPEGRDALTQLENVHSADETRKATVLPTLQAEVFWLREQLDRERSKANTTPAATVTPADARRLALETAQKQREVSNLQTQVTCLRQHLLEAEAMLHSQTADLALCKRAQLQHDWLQYADTRKRLLDSMAETESANSKVTVTAKALKQEQQKRADLEERLSGLQHKLLEYEGEAAAATSAAAEATARLRAGSPPNATDLPLLGGLFSLGAIFAHSTEQLPSLPSLRDVHFPQLFPSSTHTPDHQETK